MSSRQPARQLDAALPVPDSDGDFEVTPGLRTGLAASLREQLSAEKPAISPRFLYDELGSHLFALITEVPDYYPTRTEAAILAANIDDIVATRPVAGCTMIDLGAGNCAKAASLFDAVKPAKYVAVDVSAEFLEDALSRLRDRFPSIEMMGVGADFSERLELPANFPEGKRLFFYPGSSIGNFSRAEAAVFLSSVREAMGPDDALWITADLDKDPAVLERAYDDELGITAAFNRNVLNHVNRIADTDFALADWRHVALYNHAEMRIEMHLEATRDVRVQWPGGERRFQKGDRIHTENSHKYTIDRFSQLLVDSGMKAAKHWTDDRDWLSFFVAVPQ